MDERANDVLVTARDVTKVYRTGKVEAQALRGITLEVKAGDFLAIVGPSGSGKTTLLNLIGALDSATSGRLTVLGRDISAMGKRQRADLRLHSLGFVFQAYNLVPVLTAQENVEFVLELQGAGSERRRRAREVLERLGLGDFAHRRPNELSGGQQQRVAVARAIASRPKLVLADEPTANLDGENAEILLDLMRDLNEKHGITFLFSTHDPRVVAHARRVVTLVDGRVARDEATDRSANASAGRDAAAELGLPEKEGVSDKPLKDVKDESEDPIP
jgi:putative ABC transport system ATP-binding protein